MLIAQALEERILAHISAALPQSLPPYVALGFWQPSVPGVLSHVETLGDAAAVIEVATSLGRRQMASVSAVDYSVSVNLCVRLELDAQGSALLDFAAPLQTLFDGWMDANYQRPLTVLDVPGLSVDGVSVDGGEPRIDATAHIARIAWTLSLSGNYT